MRNLESMTDDELMAMPIAEMIEADRCAIIAEVRRRADRDAKHADALERHQRMRRAGMRGVI